MDKKIKVTRAEEIDRLILKISAMIENEYEIPEDKKDFFENDFFDELEESLSELFDWPDYGSYN